MNVEEMPFDQYQRYRLVSDLLGKLRGKRAKLEVLDVGGRTALLRGFLPKDHVTLVDVEASAEHDLVLGDGARLPFRDKSFDVVAAFDTLEHVPPELRTAFVRECARVSRAYVVLAGPYHSPQVAEAEEILQAFLRDKLDFVHRYLEEHRHNGLPSREDTVRELSSLGAKVESLGHANLERWLAMMCLSLYLDHDPALRGLAARVHEFYNRALYASDHAEPVYRHVVVASFNGSPLPKAESLLDASCAPSGALKPFTQLSAELVAFDRERAAWNEERERLGQVNHDLKEDLAGHTAMLEEVERDLALEREHTSRLRNLLEDERERGEKAIASLEADLLEHKRTLEVLEQDTEQLRAAQAELEAALAEQRAQAQAAISALEADLAGHQARIADLSAKSNQQLEMFEGERAEVRDLIDRVNREVAGERELLAHVEGELAAREAHVAKLLELAADERAQAAAAIAAGQAEIAAQQQLIQDLAEAAEAQHEEFAKVMKQWADEHARAKDVIAELRSQVEANVEARALLQAELEREQHASAEVKQTLNDDLREHRIALQAHQAELAAQRETIETLEYGRALEREAAEAQRAGAAAVQDELSEELERHRALVAELEDELKRTRNQGHAIQSELVASLTSAEDLGRKLVDREVEITSLRALLRSRVKNLGRAFSFKKPTF